MIDPFLRADAIDTNRFSDSSLRKIKRRDHREHARNARRTFGSVPESDSDSDGSHKKSCSRKSKPEVNAAFRTRHGAIKLVLAVVQSGSGAAKRGKDKKARGRIMLSSRHGRIDVDLVSGFFNSVGEHPELTLATVRGAGEPLRGFGPVHP